MELLLQSPILISGSFGINTDIFETNIINQIILLVGLYFVVGNALKESLAQRQAEINNAVTDSEKRLVIKDYNPEQSDYKEGRVYIDFLTKIAYVKQGQYLIPYTDYISETIKTD